MDRALLSRSAKRAVLGFTALCGAALFASCTLDDPLLELDPALVQDSSFTYLDASESGRVARKHVLESFGAYGCASCPDAEGRLEPYLRPGIPAYNPNLVIVNYHVAFPSTLTDPWITPGTQARHDRFGFTSLPQVKMDGSNAPFGIREKDVRFAQGEYDSLARRAGRNDSTPLELRVDSAVTFYDSAAQRWEVGFTALNRGDAAQGALAFRVLLVKNASALTPTLPNHPWEVIVAETTDKDTSGALMTLSRMPGLTAKSWRARLAAGPEAPRHVPPSQPENPRDYAIVLLVENASGIVQNVFSRNFNPH